MFGIIAYAGVSFVAALVLTLGYVMTRPFKQRDETRPGKVFAALLAVALICPYLAVEIMTRALGPTLDKAVKSAFSDADVQGDMVYYKVLLYTGSRAKILAVGREKQVWGAYDRPQVAMDLVRKGSDWKLDSERIVASDRLGKDGITYPPYW